MDYNSCIDMEWMQNIPNGCLVGQKIGNDMRYFRIVDNKPVEVHDLDKSVQQGIIFKLIIPAEIKKIRKDEDEKIPEPYARVVDRLQKHFPIMQFGCKMGWCDPDGKRYWKVFCDDIEIWSGGTSLFYDRFALSLKGVDMETQLCKYLAYDIYNNILKIEAPYYPVDL